MLRWQEQVFIHICTAVARLGYLALARLSCNFNDRPTILYLIIVIFNTSSGIKYVLLQLTVVKVTACVFFAQTSS